MTRRRVVCAVGTRPEAIKMAPVHLALGRSRALQPLLLLTGQHREQLQQALALFALPVDANLDVMTDRQALPELAGRIVPQAAAALRALDADYVLVHGDTLTTFAVSWAAFLSNIPVGHVEAGLRSHRLDEPFPEEANRKLTDAIADLCLAPTATSRANLEREGIAGDRIVITGQTGIDAIAHAARLGQGAAALAPGRHVTITLHRRESWAILGELAAALARVARRFPDVTFVYPVHLNPIVRDAVWPALASEPNVRLVEPLEYGAMARLMASSELIVTDSGGMQEEGAALHVPVVVVRNVTERPEGVLAGGLRLAGTDPAAVERIVAEILGDPSVQQAMRAAPNPYGDGCASERVVAAIEWRLAGGARPEDWAPAP